uniref:TAF6 C-terminal HEAT repeat domain-containing protein n=1 Tax=Strigamia maritima TaxID=126957 RepID=T1IMM4_STRMM
MSYYEQMTKAILGYDEELMKVALEDLRASSKIAPLLPYLINFVSVGVKKVSHDLAQLTKLVFTVNSLICNQSLYMEPKPYLCLLTQGLLYCILEPLAASINPTNDHWTLRDYAARLLALIARNWTSSVNELSNEILTSLRDVFSDHNKPFSSHYGAIIGIVAFGSEAIEKYLLPFLIKYWPHLSAVIYNEFYPNAQVKADAYKVYGALIVTKNQDNLASQIIMMERTERFFQEPPDPSISIQNSVPQQQIKTKNEDIKPALTSKTPISQIYNFFCECFGDSLSMRLPHVPSTSFYIPKPDPVVNLFTSPELVQSGEELLEAFVVKDEELQSMSADDEHSYDDRDDNSLLSDDNETEPVARNMDLRIKSTVSDPNLGIKLTIAKLPRSCVTRPFKRKKLSIKIKKEPVEEPSEPEEPFMSILCMGNRRVVIEFCFAGAMPIPEGRLKRNVILPNFNEPFVESDVHRISLRMKKKGKLKVPCARKWWARKILSANIETII